MKTQELKLEHLAPYLPYELNLKHEEGYLLTMDAAGESGRTLSIMDVEEYAKPILRPLSDLTNKESNLLLDKDILAVTYDIKLIRYGDVLKLLEWHFDVFGLIEKGLAIDINTIN